MAKITIAVLAILCTSFFCGEEYVSAGSFQKCVSWEKFFSLPGEVIMEPVFMKLPEFEGRSERIATRIKKHTGTFDITLLVFNLNKKSEPLFERITMPDGKESIFVFEADNTCARAHSDQLNFQPVYHFASSENRNDRTTLLAMRFYLAKMGPDDEPIIIDRTFLLEKPIVILNPLVKDKELSKQPFHDTRAEIVRKISVSVFVENGCNGTLCKNHTEKECQAVIQSLFDPVVQRFSSEFGILIKLDSIVFRLPINQTLGFSADDKKGLETLFMYQYSLNAVAEELRKDNPHIDVVVGVAEGLPRDSSDLTSDYYGTILMNAYDPFHKRNLIHEFGHMFCARDNRQPHAMMNGRGNGMQDKFLPEDIDAIFRNKNRIFSYENVGRSEPYVPCKL